MKIDRPDPSAYDYLIVNVQSWETPIGTNSRDIARGLARRGRVLFVNPAADWAKRLRGPGANSRVAPEATQRLAEVEPNLWVLRPNVTLSSINWLPDNLVYDQLNRYNNALLAGEIRWAMDQLGMKTFVLLNDSEMFRGFYLKELLRPACYAYYTRDNLMQVDYWRRHGARLEPAIMRKADLVLANSAYLRTVAARSNPNSVDVGQGCDLTQFEVEAYHAEPEDLTRLPHPRIGYAGALTAMRLDIPLLEGMATQRPHWQLVLVGPEDDAFRSSRLHALPNVHFLGSKRVTELPAYFQHLAVLINPQVLNELTIGNYPRKVDEYLAMGKPVVATRTEVMEDFRQHVLLAETADSFITQVENALAGRLPSSPAERVQFAQGHSWENSVAAIDRAIKQSIEQTVAVQIPQHKMVTSNA